MVGVALLFLLFFRDGQIQLWEALVFLAVIVGYTVLNIRLARRQASAEVQQEFGEGVPPADRLGVERRGIHCGWTGGPGAGVAPVCVPAPWTSPGC